MNPHWRLALADWILTVLVVSAISIMGTLLWSRKAYNRERHDIMSAQLLRMDEILREKELKRNKLDVEIDYLKRLELEYQKKNRGLKVAIEAQMCKIEANNSKVKEMETKIAEQRAEVHNAEVTIETKQAKLNELEAILCKYTVTDGMDAVVLTFEKMRDYEKQNARLACDNILLKTQNSQLIGRCQQLVGQVEKEKQKRKSYAVYSGLF